MSGIFPGGVAVKGIYVTGGTAAQAAYLGSTQVWALSTGLPALFPFTMKATPFPYKFKRDASQVPTTLPIQLGV